jgi:hypothetical protein
MTCRRVPRRDDPWIVANAARMYEILSVVNEHPLGMPLTEDTVRIVQGFFGQAYEAGIDTIGVSEGGFSEG